MCRALACLAQVNSAPTQFLIFSRALFVVDTCIIIIVFMDWLVSLLSCFLLRGFEFYVPWLELSRLWPQTCDWTDQWNQILVLYVSYDSQLLEFVVHLVYFFLSRVCLVFCFGRHQSGHAVTVLPRLLT